MKELKIFISYSHEDYPIAQELSNVLNQAFGRCLAIVFLDKIAISFGDSIKETIAEKLGDSDILIAIITSSSPASVLSWPAFEVGIFRGSWRHGKPDRQQGKVVGQVAVMLSDIPQIATLLGPETGNRPINLGFSETLLADPRPEDEILAEVAERSELLNYLNEMENLLRDEKDYDEFFRARMRTPSQLVADFNKRTFRELKRRVRNTLKPSRQILIRYDQSRRPDQPWELPENAKITSVGGAAEVFGKHEGEPPFVRIIDPYTGKERFEADWHEFKNSVENNSNGLYWCDVLTQAATRAAIEGTEFDQNLVLTSVKDKRFRVVPTTVSKYFNNDAEVSIYLIEALLRKDYGDLHSSQALRALNLISRFQFAFLEINSPFTKLNFRPKENELTKVWELQTELDYLDSETKNANLDVAGLWTHYMSVDQLTLMAGVWTDIKQKLRAECNQALGRDGSTGGSTAWIEGIRAQLERISREMRPFISQLGKAIAAKLRDIYGDDGTNDAAATR